MSERPSAAFERLRDWMFRLRGPQPEPIVLSHKRIYLMPTGAGVVFGFALLIMMLASINYALSLGLVLTFLLGGVALAGAMSGFRNMLNLEIAHGRSMPVFCGEAAHFTLVLTNRRASPRQSIECVGEAACTFLEKLEGARNAPLTLELPTRERGWLSLPWVKLQTRFPMGLVNVWAYVRPPMKVLVYPRPETDPPPLPAAPGLVGQHAINGSGADDFDGLRAHRATDSPRHIAWKIAARDGPLMVKQFSGHCGGRVVLAWQSLPERMGVEQKLSRLTAWVRLAHDSGLGWQLRLPNLELDFDSGSEHYRACLRALALYGLDQ